MEKKLGLIIVLFVLVIVLSIYFRNNVQLGPRISKTNVQLEQQISNLQFGLFESQRGFFYSLAGTDTDADILLVNDCVEALDETETPQDPQASGNDNSEPRQCKCLRAIVKTTVEKANERCRSALQFCEYYNACRDILRGIEACGVPIPPTTQTQCEDLNTCTGGECDYEWREEQCVDGAFCPDAPYHNWDCWDIKSAECGAQRACNIARQNAEKAKEACEAAGCTGCDLGIPLEANCLREGQPVCPTP